MEREELKQELLNRIFNEQPKDFEIKKIPVSDDDPILEQIREWESLFAHTKMRQKSFFGIMIGWWY
ncbi:hypothetical protein LC087_16450 [Bacillus carboniphilus]|uniref:Uncharacterized protein n=1 Tax=Bacillus carboniphilus TaxID=86663 RepID=A0ABY9JU76_9BACI|nr:hypothetical protein [Bacillus carboniphilus]WLR42293.1 hypothetical protein LC087_16450 [Bacillus carboniphilus]